MAGLKVQVILEAIDKATGTLSKFGANVAKQQKSLVSSFTDISKNAAIASVGIVAVGVAVAKMAKTAGKAESVRDSFKQMTEGWGQDARTIIDKTKEASRNTISEFDIMQGALKSMTLIGKDAMGDLTETFPKMAEIAKKASRTTGHDVGFMLESIVNGIGRSSVKWLDNTGIVIDATNAYKKYAQSIGGGTKVVTLSAAKEAELTETLRKRENQLAITEQKQREFNDKTKESTRMIVSNNIQTRKNQIETLKASLANKTWTEAITITGKNLTEEQKKIALLNEYLRKAEELLGDVSVTSGGYSGALQELTATTHDLLYGESGIITAMLPSLTDLVRAIIPIAKEWGPKLAEAIKGLTEWFTNLDPWLQGTVAGMVALAPAITAVAAVVVPTVALIKTLAGIFKVTFGVLFGGAGFTVFGLGAAATGGLLAAIGLLYVGLNWLSKKITGFGLIEQFKAALILLKPVVQGVMSDIGDLIREMDRLATKKGWSEFKRGLQISQYDEDSLGPWMEEHGAFAKFVPGTDWYGKQHGGTVTGGTPYTVGEAGPETFVPFSSGRIEPAIAPSNVNLTVNVGMYAGTALEKRRIAEEMFNELKFLSRSRGMTLFEEFNQ